MNTRMTTIKTWPSLDTTPRIRMLQKEMRSTKRNMTTVIAAKKLIASSVRAAR